MESEKEKSIYNLDNSDIFLRSTIFYSTEIESDEIVFTSICRRCKEDESKGELIHPCRCIGDREFIHVHCLEIISNVRKQTYCTYCKAPFPLERKDKSLIEICRNIRRLYFSVFRRICYFLMMVLSMIIFNAAMSTLLTIFFISIFEGKPFANERILTYFATLVLLGLYGWLMKYQIILLQDAFKTLRIAYNRWLDCTKDWKVTNNRLHIFRKL